MRKSAGHLLLRFASVLALLFVLHNRTVQAEGVHTFKNLLKSRTEFSKFGAHITYYEVHGESFDARRDSALKHGPVDQSGIRREALTRWNVAWELKGGILIIACYVQVVLPFAMETKIPEQEHKKWSLYQEQLQDHEAVHVQLIRRFIEETAREIESQFGLKVRLYAHTDHKIRQTELVSPDVEQFMQHRLQKLYAQQVEFDTLSKHGRIVATDEMLKQLS